MTGVLTGVWAVTGFLSGFWDGTAGASGSFSLSFSLLNIFLRCSETDLRLFKALGGAAIIPAWSATGRCGSVLELGL